MISSWISSLKMSEYHLYKNLVCKIPRRNCRKCTSTTDFFITFNTRRSQSTNLYHTQHTISYSTKQYHVQHNISRSTSNKSISHSTNQYHIQQINITFNKSISHSTNQYHVEHQNIYQQSKIAVIISRQTLRARITV